MLSLQDRDRTTKQNQYEQDPLYNTKFEPLLTSEAAAQLLKIHVKTVQLMARRGVIPGSRIGKLRRFRSSELDAWIRNQK